MKRLILCLFLVFCLTPFSYLGAQDVKIEQLYQGAGEEEFGFTGYFDRIELKRLPINDSAEFIPLSQFATTAPKVRLLNIGKCGGKQHVPPNPKFLHFYLYGPPEVNSYYEYDMIGMVVINNENVAVPIAITFELIGPSKMIFTRAVKIPANSVQLYRTRITLSPEIFLYTVKGRVDGAGIVSDNTVTTRFYKDYTLWRHQ